jgi:hypothetical protein
MTPNLVKGSNSLPADRFDDPKHPSNLAKYQPNSLKNKTDSSSSQASGAMDGDHSAKSLDQGANSAANVSDMADGIHEAADQTVCANVVGNS